MIVTVNGDDWDNNLLLMKNGWMSYDYSEWKEYCSFGRDRGVKG